MKKIIVPTLILILHFIVSSDLLGQNKPEPKYYLNSKQVEFKKVFINPLRIDSINATKDSKEGEIWITTKNHEFTYLNLADILKKYAKKIERSNNSVLFQINDELIKDTASIMIDDTYFVYVKTEKLTDATYIQTEFQNLTIVSIDLETKERIILRGNQVILERAKINNYN